MTDPTPTRAEVERFGCDQLGMDKIPDGEWVRFTDYQSLRERAEAAERDRSRLIIANGQLIDDAVSMGMARDAAWNDAIEAAQQKAEQYIAMGWRGAELPEAIRALRRAAPTEDRCAECDCQNGGTECTWIKSGPVVAPTEGEA